MKKILIAYICIWFVCSPALALTVDDSIDAVIRQNINTDAIQQDLLPNLPKESPVPVFDVDQDFSQPQKPTHPVLNAAPSVVAPSQPAVKQAVPSYVPAPQKTAPVAQTYQKQVAPSLPQVVTKKIEVPVSNVQKTVQMQVNQSYNRQYKNLMVRRGTHFKLRLLTPISDATPSGTRVSFVSVYPETTRYVTIPSGTIFKGSIVNSHRPQLLGNGGLIEIKIDEMVYKNQTFFIDSKICKANYKRVYLNNLKGKQKYVKSIGTITKPGTRFMKKMFTVTGQLANGPEIILTPFAIVGGVLVYGVNLICSPVFAMFSLGDSIKLPSGTYFVIKLRSDALLRDH